MTKLRAFAALLTLANPAFAQEAEVRRPNVLFFLVDDMGVTDTSEPFVLGEEGEPITAPLNARYRTPHIEALADRGFDRATIYRNLTELTEAKILSRVELGDHVWRFELKRGHDHAPGEDHPHFLCTSCGEVSCLDDVNVAITPKAVEPTKPGGKKSPDTKSVIRSVNEVLLKGQCGNCSE